MPPGKNQYSSESTFLLIQYMTIHTYDRSEHSSHDGTRPESSQVAASKDEHTYTDQGQATPDYSSKSRTEYWVEVQDFEGPPALFGGVPMTQDDYCNQPDPAYLTPSTATQGSGDTTVAEDHGNHHGDYDYEGFDDDGYSYERQHHTGHEHKSHEHKSHKHKGQDHKRHGHKSHGHKSSDHKDHDRKSRDTKSRDHRGHGSSTDARASGQKKSSGRK